MSAPVGNKFWEARSSHGRNLTFDAPEKLEAACIEYFEWCEANPLLEAQPFAYQGVVTMAWLPHPRAFTLGGMVVFLGMARTTWGHYREREDFQATCQRMEEIIRTQKFEGAAAGLFNASIIARDLGLADRQEVTGADGAPLRAESDLDRAKAAAFLLAKGMKAMAQQQATPDTQQPADHQRQRSQPTPMPSQWREFIERK